MVLIIVHLTCKHDYSTNEGPLEYRKPMQYMPYPEFSAHVQARGDEFLCFPTQNTQKLIVVPPKIQYYNFSTWQ